MGVLVGHLLAAALGFRRGLAPCVGAGLALLLLTGCGEEQQLTLAKYLEELEFDAPLEEVRFVELGEYHIPIAVTGSTGKRQVNTPAWMQLQFRLSAETAPEHESAVQKAVDRQQGAFHDAVLTICRTTSIDELGDPRLAAVRSRLSDVAKSLFGEDRIRALVLNEIQTEFL
jgi:hypothetical protein